MALHRSLTALSVTAVLSVATVACTNDTGSEEAFCAQVGEVPTMGVLLTDFSDADPAELERRLDAGANAYDALRDAAPEEIRGRVDQVVDLVADVIDAVRANPNAPEALNAAVRTAVTEHPDVKAAAIEVETYARTTCDIEFEPEVAPDAGG